jgi:peptide/nickel transport system permease protein
MVSKLPVSTLLAPRLLASLQLAGLTALVSVPVALMLGILAAVRRGTMLDRVISMATIGIVSVPEFVIATVMVLIFAVRLHWLPALSSSRDFSSLHDVVRCLPCR